MFAFASGVLLMPANDETILALIAEVFRNLNAAVQDLNAAQARIAELERQAATPGSATDMDEVR
jgi:hypothetical protein